MRLRSCALTLAIVILVITIGCSSVPGENPMTPESDKSTSTNAGHRSWGLWQFIADPNAGTLDVIPLRGADMHLNAIVFLEPPALLNLTLDYLEFIGNLIIVDIGLRHPFLGLTEFSGFDVCGVLISNGNVTGFSDYNLRMAGEGDTRLLNYDGLTRWWNPSEFPSNSGMLGYTDGLLGVPDSTAGFNCTLNGYKYYSDLLENTTDILTIDPAARGLFSAGQKNIRRFEIELGTDGLVFNYAIDANWIFPTGSPPYSAPDDFPANANRVEAWIVRVTETDNTLYYDDTSGTGGGSYSVQINVYDHYNADSNSVRIEAPGLFTWPIVMAAPVGGTAEYSTYEFEVIGIAPQNNDDTLMLISVESEESGYGGLLPDEIVSAYFTHTINISPDPPTSSGWSDPITIDTNSEMPRACVNTADELVLAYHKNGAGIQYVFNDGTWGTPEMMYDTDPNFMHIIPGESGQTTYLSFYGIGQDGDDRHGLRYQGNPGTWDYMWLYGYTDQASLLLPDGDGSFTHIYTYTAGGVYTGKTWMIRFGSWGSNWYGMYGGDEETVRMGSANFIEQTSTTHLIGYYRDDYARIYHAPRDDSNTLPFYTIYACAPNEDVDSVAITQETDGTLHAVYRVIDVTDFYKIEHKSSTDDGVSWSNPADVLYNNYEQPLMDYISIDNVDTGDHRMIFSEEIQIYEAISNDGQNWEEVQIVLGGFLPQSGNHYTQPYLYADGNTYHLFFIDKPIYSTYGDLKYTSLTIE